GRCRRRRGEVQDPASGLVWPWGFNTAANARCNRHDLKPHGSKKAGEPGRLSRKQGYDTPGPVSFAPVAACPATGWVRPRIRGGGYLAWARAVAGRSLKALASLVSFSGVRA